MADYESGLQVIDISDPANPAIIGNYDTPGDAFSVTVAGDCAFVSDYTAGLQLIDISDPTNPSLLSNCTAVWANDVAIEGDRAYVAASGTSGEAPERHP